MKLCSFRLHDEPPGSEKIGTVRDDEVYPLDDRPSMEAYGRLLSAPAEPAAGKAHRLGDVVLATPLPRPGKILATIVNTRGMLGGDLTLERPRLDMKAPSTVIGPGATILAPASGLRPEVELGAVIGKILSGANERESSSGILGYTIVNDVTAPSDSREDSYEAYRKDDSTGELRRRTMRGPLFRSKNHDGFCPMGPYLVTSDELADTSDLKMRTLFDGEVVQEGSTSDYIFTPPQIASYVSGFLTLEPGDVISCGSVGWAGAALNRTDPTEFLLPKRPGMLELEVEGIGVLRNPVVYR